MIGPDEALPGRDTPMQVDPQHVVLGTSIVPPFPDGTEQIVVAMGCFWGAERIFWQLPGVVTTAVGYMGGWTKHPTYEETCTSRTGHTESVLVVYDPDEITVDELMKAFWENHDPTTPNRQGNDIGTQYRSAMFPVDNEQRAAFEAARERADALWGGGVVTEIGPVIAFVGSKVNSYMTGADINVDGGSDF